MRKHLLLATSLAILLACPTAAHAADNWTEPFPGVRLLDRTTSEPNHIAAAVVDLCAGGVSIRATKSAERQRTPSSFGQLVGAQVVANGDFFSFDDYSTTGLAIGDGEVWPNSGDGPTHGFIAFGDGKSLVSNPTDVVAVESWMNDVVGGNVMVLRQGQVTNDTGTFCTTRNPRTVAGISQDGRYLILAVIDGRSSASRGMRCDEMGALMKDLGAYDAINLDGGGSSAMWAQGLGVLNVPSDGSQRVVANHLAIIADGSDRPGEACPIPPDFDVQVRYDGPEDFYQDGASKGIPDVLEGDTLKAQILITNRSVRKMPNLIAGYWFEDPFLAATDYTIYTDHPAHDQSTWMVNDADMAEENPPKDALGTDGFLTLYAFSTDETKRVEISMTADRYSIGAADHPDVRSWVKHIANVYGEQDAWDTEPTNSNRVGHLLQNFAQLDVLSPDEWQFDGGAGEFEGVRACDDTTDGLSMDTDAGALVTHGCVHFPSWTSVDADRFDEMVVRMDTSAADAKVVWHTDGQRREANFVLGEGHDHVFEFGTNWKGTIEDLQLGVDAGDAAIDAVWFQASDGSGTSSDRETFDDTPPAEVYTGDQLVGDDAGGPGAADDGPSMSAGDGGCGCQGSGEVHGALLLICVPLASRRFRRRGRRRTD